MTENTCQHKMAKWSWNPLKLLKEIVQIRCQTRKEPQESANYCEKHGCQQCGYANLKGEYQNPPKNFKTNFGEKVCSIKCKDKSENDYWKKGEKEREKKLQEKAELWKEVFRLDNKLETEVKNIFAPFSELINKINGTELKRIYIAKDTENFSDQFTQAIDSCWLEDAEREQWKKLYQNISAPNELINICHAENALLTSLATKYKSEEEKRRQDNSTPECKKCQLQREQPITFPTGCENWCQECIKQKQREEQVRNNNCAPPVDNPSPTDHSQKSYGDNSHVNNFDNPTSSQNDNDNQERERERERERESKTVPILLSLTLECKLMIR